MDIRISLARMYYPVRVLGPGERVGLWLTGCDRRCPGCISPELQPYDSTREVGIGAVREMIGRIGGQIDGFTVSGGEPFYRPRALRALTEMLYEISDDILIYTGYTLEELCAMQSPDVQAVLDRCAALVDGPYIRAQNDGIGQRGSANQRCRVFRYPEKYADLCTTERAVQTVVYGRSVLTVGIPE